MVSAKSSCGPRLPCHRCNTIDIIVRSSEYFKQLIGVLSVVIGSIPSNVRAVGGSFIAAVALWLRASNIFRQI